MVYLIKKFIVYYTVVPVDVKIQLWIEIRMPQKIYYFWWYWNYKIEEYHNNLEDDTENQVYLEI